VPGLRFAEDICRQDSAGFGKPSKQDNLCHIYRNPLSKQGSTKDLAPAYFRGLGNQTKAKRSELMRGLETEVSDPDTEDAIRGQRRCSAPLAHGCAESK
jgi:hypothetical protein